MARASITDTQELLHFRGKLVKFADELRVSLADADGEIQRTLSWLDGEAPNHWQRQLRKLHEQVQQTKAAIRDKKLSKTPTGAAPSTAIEEKQLRMLLQKQEHAQQKLANCKRWRQLLDKEVLAYRGMARRAHGIVETTVPAATAELDRAATALEQYTSLAAPEAPRPADSASDADSVARPTDVIEPPTEPDTDEPANPEADDER